MRTRTIGRGLALAGIATLALALSAAGATAKGHGKKLGKTAATQCSKEKHALGKQAFDAVYGKPSMPNCIGVKRPEVRAAVSNASRDCRAERKQIGKQAFAQKYGSNKNKRNAFGKCVSGKTKPALAADRQETVNAANACRAEREDPEFATGHDGKTFDEFYGTNKNGHNAFGKCVSGKAHATA
jgi:hypothetical protein